MPTTQVISFMRFAPSFLDELRARVPISAIVGPRVSWDRRKSNASRGDYWACCPFHGEKTASFHCDDQKGRYHCFGCGVSGDHFRFLSEMDGVGFPEAVEHVAEIAGLPLPARDPQAQARERQRASLYDVMETAALFFEDRLQAPEGAGARVYLRERGLATATQRAFRLGFAPERRSALKEYLAGKGVAKEEMEACGLVRHGDDIPVSYDWFRGRIMFPIADTRGRIIAFGGRALSPDSPAKYMNSPDTELFHKGKILYNLAQARRAVGKDGTIIVVEGYMDVIALSQAGFGNVVAPLGTALTEMQLELLWRVCGEPVLCFDGDQAGLRAAWRAADTALPLVGAGRTLRFALLPSGQDPDDLVAGAGAQALAAVLEGAMPLAELLWMRETSGRMFDTPERRAELEKTLRELTSRIRDETVRRHYVQDMRERVFAFFRPHRRPAQASGFAPGDKYRRGHGEAGPGRLVMSQSLARSALVKSAGSAMSPREAILIATLVNHPALIDEFMDQVELLEFDHGDLHRLHGALLDAIARDQVQDREAVIAVLKHAGLSDAWQRVVELLRRLRHWPAMEEAALDDAREAFAQALHLHRSHHTLHKELRMAEAALAADPSEENYRHLLDIQAQFRDVQATEALIEGFGVLSGRAARNF